ncbi:MAG TPA: DUF5069 domain-containing protein [Chthoniobacterales bacterium]|nr:DUF5069 domain-containing protein [Chthoniobacterales bacterium]
MSERKFPKSPRETTKGIIYFPRMLDKIRMHLNGELHEDYQANFGTPQTADSALCNFLRVHHRDLIKRVEQGGTDEEILEWCFEKSASSTRATFLFGTISCPNSAGAIRSRRDWKRARRTWG